jgi:hypothetical protein
LRRPCRDAVDKILIRTERVEHHEVVVHAVPSASQVAPGRQYWTAEGFMLASKFVPGRIT